MGGAKLYTQTINFEEGAGDETQTMVDHSRQIFKSV